MSPSDERSFIAMVTRYGEASTGCAICSKGIDSGRYFSVHGVVCLTCYGECSESERGLTFGQLVTLCRCRWPDEDFPC